MAGQIDPVSQNAEMIAGEMDLVDAVIVEVAGEMNLVDPHARMGPMENDVH